MRAYNAKAQQALVLSRIFNAAEAIGSRIRQLSRLCKHP